jgi:type I restriction-modification system DNA methylase subunit
LGNRNKQFSTRTRNIMAQIDQGIIVTETELERAFLNLVENELRCSGFSPVIEQQRRIVRGREDARIGGLIFEFKKPSKKDTLEDLGTRKPQIDSYINEYQSQGIVLKGVLTNGYKIIFVDEEKNVVEKGNLDECLWMLETWVSALALKLASPSDLKNLLGPFSTLGKGFIKELYDAYVDHSEEMLIKESFEMWDGVYGCATNLNEGSIEAVKKFAKNSLDITVQTKTEVKALLFIIETYLSIFMKLIVAEVAKQKNIVPVTSLEELLGEDLTNGYAKLSERIPFLSKLFEYDTFFWFIDLVSKSSEIQKAISQYLTNIIAVLSKMDFAAVSTDLIKQTYQGFFDSATRRALGEFYTPDNLVDEVLDSVGYRDKQICETLLLDPACGSGTFLVRAIDRLLNAVNSDKISKDVALKRIVEGIVGIDIHPFAVAMARVNYLLALGRLIDPTVRKTIKNLNIPVYWADSLATRSKKTEFGAAGHVMTVEVKVPVLGTFILPDPTNIDWTNLIDASLHAINAEWSDERFLEGFNEAQRLAYKSVLLEFLQIFKDRKKKGMNGRWLSTLRNFVVIDQFKQHCDFVVGNPPWVRVHNLNKDIRSELMSKFEVYKKDKKSGKVVGWRPRLKATKIPFPQQIDYCMAFVESGVDYLNENGRLGLVISSKITSALYANLLRRFLIERTSLVKIIDHSISNQRFFEEATNSPLVLVASKAVPSNSFAALTFDAFKSTDWKTKQNDVFLVAKDPESPWCLAPPQIASIFRRVQKNNLRLGDIFTVYMGVKTSLNDIFLVKEIAATATQGLLTVVNEEGNKENIEAELLRHVVKGRDIEAWRFSSPRYIIWTHDENGNPLENLPKHASEYFSKYNKKLLARNDYKKNQPPWTIYRVTKEKLGRKVGWQELSKMMEAVIIEPEIDDDILGKRLLVPLQTVYFITTGNSDLDFGIAGILNSSFVRAFVSSFSLREMGQPPRFRHFSWTVGLVPLPSDFTKQKISSALKGIIEISKEMHACKGEDKKLAEELDGKVAELYGVSKPELSSLNRYLRDLGIPTIHECES